MKLLRIFLLTLIICVYGYSVFMTSRKPQEQFWGFLCAAIFLVLSIWGVRLYVKFGNKDKDS